MMDLTFLYLFKVVKMIVMWSNIKCCWKFLYLLTRQFRGLVEGWLSCGFCLSFCFVLFYEVGFLYVALTILELTV